MENILGKDLTNGSVFKNLLSLTLPMLTVTLLDIGYGIINAIWIGNLLGRDALAAITVSFPITFLLISMASGSTIGTSSY